MRPPASETPVSETPRAVRVAELKRRAQPPSWADAKVPTAAASALRRPCASRISATPPSAVGTTASAARAASTTRRSRRFTTGWLHRSPVDETDLVENEKRFQL